jgi:DNA-binding beta-propeller fold protein YncE
MRTVFAMLAAWLILAGCAAEKPKPTERYVWPPPPDPPKIEFIKSYYGADDYPKSAFEVLLDSLFGKKTLRIAKPIDIKSNGKGLVYVTDVELAGIFVFDLPNQKTEFWGKSSDVEKGLGITPYYIALDDAGNIYTVGRDRQEIYVLNPEGGVVRRIDFGEQVKAPAGLVVDSAGGRIYLVDSIGCKVVVFDLAGKHLFSFGKPGEGDGEFNRPSPITINGKKEIIIGDTHNGRIQIFDRDGKFLRKFGQRGDSVVDFQIIKGVAVDSDDDIYVTDAKANQFKVFNTNGQPLIFIGATYAVTPGKDVAGGFLLPQGIHIDKNDSIFVADQVNRRFQHYKYLKDEKAPDASGAKK